MAVNDRQQSYLDAMGIQVWRSRRAAVAGVQEAESAESTVTAVSESEPDETSCLENPVSSHELRSLATHVQEDDNKLPSTLGQQDDWPQLEKRVAACIACELFKTRTQTVFGVGDKQAGWMVVGEAPGAEEDRQGEPFVGRAGQLLNKMLLAIGLKREQVFIANMLKCRPPNNRDPRPEEMEQCAGYLRRQIELLQPKIILVVGRVAAQQLLKSNERLGAMRGKRFSYSDVNTDIPVVVTYHPAYLLRSPKEKRKAWQDLQFAQKVYAEVSGK